MGSMFDSEVDAERRRLPGATISLPRLMDELMWSGEGREATVTVMYRADVSTSEWWEIRWGDRVASASTLELAMFRAAVMLRRETRGRRE